MIYKKSDTDGDGTVSNIKCRPVEIHDINIQKIDHFTYTDPVNDITDSPAHDQRQTKRKQSLARGCFGIQIENQTHGHKRRYQKEKVSDKHFALIISTCLASE